MNPNLKKELINLIFRLKKIRPTQLPGVNLHMGELFVMRKIAELTPDSSRADSEANINMTDIQNSLHITKPAVSQMLNALEKKGYINREIDPKDHRRFITSLTPRGEQITVAMRDYIDRAITQTITRFGEENMAQMINLFNQFINIVEDVQTEFLEAEAKKLSAANEEAELEAAEGEEGAKKHD